MKSLSYLIAKCDWNEVYQRLQSAPEEASIPIPTCYEGTVYPLHKAICSKSNPMPRKVLLFMIEQFPNALDQNVFIGACENPRLSRDSMELLLSLLSIDIYQIVQHNAQYYAFIAAKKKNTCTVQLFIDRFPCVLNGNILAQACIYGTAEMVEKILAAGVSRGVGKSGGLFLKTNEGEDALDVAIRLYDEKDTERRLILIACLQYANAAKMGMKMLHPDYPTILAAIGLVPKRILKSLLKLYAHELTNTNESGKHAILKAIHMSIKEKEGDDCDQLPHIFKSVNLIDACNDGNLELMQQLLEKGIKHTYEELSGEESKPVILSENTEECAMHAAVDPFDENDNGRCEILNICIHSWEELSQHSYDELSMEEFETDILSENGPKNALDLAVDLFDENDNGRCEILKMCIQYANAAKLGSSIPPSNYPILLAAVGLVPPEYFLSLGNLYHHDIKKMDRIGKFALKKVLKMAEEDYLYKFYG